MENEDLVTFPKGTIVKFDGLPCRLTEDTIVVSSTIAKLGPDWVKEKIAERENRGPCVEISSI